MTTFTEPRLDFEALISEGMGTISRDTVIVASGSGVVKACTIMGQLTIGSGATSTSAAKVGNTGNGTLVPDASTPLLAGAQGGVYVVTFTSATAYGVVDPLGASVGTGANGTAFATQIKFLTTAGATAFVSGDTFYVTISLGAIRVVPAAATGSDGSQIAAGMLLTQVDATSVDVRASMISREAEIVGSMIVWGSTVNDAVKIVAKIADLAKLGISIR